MAHDVENGFWYSVSGGKAAIVRFDPHQHRLGEGETPKRLIIPPVLGGAPVTKIGRAAFASEETGIDWSEEIGRQYFIRHDPLELEEITLPEGVTEIGEQAFRKLVTLRKLEAPDGLQKIGELAFDGCSALEELKLPDSVRTLGGGAFRETGLRAFAVPAKVAYLNARLFEGCKKLKRVGLPAGLTMLSLSAFRGCCSLEAIEAAPPGQEAGDLGRTPNRKRNCWEWQAIESADGCESDMRSEGGFCSLDGVLYHREMNCLLLYPAGKRDLEFTVPESVPGIAEGAFEGNAFLEKISIPASVKKIEASTFRDCGSLREIVLPEGLDAIGPYAFQNCRSLSAIAIPESVRFLGDWAFWGCDTLQELRLPQSLRQNYLHLDGMGGLEKLWIPCGLKDLTLKDCPSLKEIAVEQDHPELSVVDGILFSKDQKTLIRMPSALPVKSYRIPDHVRSLARDAFQGSRYLEEIAFPASWRRIPDSFAHCGKLKTIHFPEGVQKIENLAFEYCTALERLVLPEGLVEVGNYSFAYCEQLKEAVIPASVKEFGVCLFEGCDQLTDVLLTGGARRWCNRTVIKDRGWNFPDCAVFRYR